MTKKRLSKGQAIGIGLLWVALVVLLFVYAKEVNFETIFTAVASGIIILVAVSKNR